MFARIYTRVSTEEQALSGFSLSAQKERLEAYCVSQAWSVAGCYIDEGVSAKDLNRSQFRRLMADVRPGEVILVYKLDRLTRSVRDLDDLLREFDRLGVKFRSLTEQFDTTTATGRLFIRMVAEMAQWERETIAERSAFGKLKKANLGEWGGGKPPIGYVAVPSDKVKAGRALLRLVPDPERAHIIPLIFDRYLAGEGVRAIALWLNDELGLRTPQGARFHRMTVSRILRNPTYCGDVEHKRSGTRVPGTHAPLIRRELFERVQTLLAARKRLPPRHATGAYPLSGVARCGVCGGRIDGQMRKGGQQRVYRCHNYLTGAGCGAEGSRPLASVSAALAEAALQQHLAERLQQQPADLGRFLASLAAPDAGPAGAAPAQAERTRLEQDIARTEMALSRWKRLFERGAIDDDEYLAEAAPHKERLNRLHHRLHEWPDEKPSADGDPTPHIRFAEAWYGLEPAERKVLLQRYLAAFNAEILLFPDRRLSVEARP